MILSDIPNEIYRIFASLRLMLLGVGFLSSLSEFYLGGEILF